jgi:Kelch motif.
MHTATLLADGRVLITGGGPASWSIGGAYLASAELFDPQTGTFSTTGQMTSTREDHTATLLADGRVLITGGDDMGSHAVATAELYDPKTGTFSATGSMKTARGFHTATPLADGRVLIVGGDDAAWSSGPFLASAELYDPKTGTFSTTGSMSVGREYHTATQLADGRVLVTGGADQGGAQSLASAELYDPKTGKFSPTGPMTAMRIYQSATLLPDGRILVAGGMSGGRDYATGTFLYSAELYDPKTGTFSPTGAMSDTRVYHTATSLSDGRVLVTGGYAKQAVTAALASAEIYDPTTGTFSPAGDGR